MSYLKGTIRGAKKTNLGTSLEGTRGQALHGPEKQEATRGGAEPFIGELIEVMQSTTADGEKILSVHGKARYKTKNGYAETPYPLRIVDSPSVIEAHGGLQEIMENKIAVWVTFLSPTRRRGYITVNAPSSDVEDYDSGEVKERDGVLIV